MPPPAAQDRPLWRAVAVPSEHGGWGLTLEPVLLGLLVGFSWPGVAIGVATFLAFLVRTPVKLALVDRRRGRTLPRTRVAWRIALVELIVLVGAVGLAIAAAGWTWLVPFAVAAPLFAVELWFDVRSRGRRLVPELCGAIGITAAAAAIVIAGGEPARLAVAASGGAGRSGARLDPLRPHADPPPPPRHAARRHRRLPGRRGAGRGRRDRSSTTVSSWAPRPSCWWRWCRRSRSAARSRPPRSSACVRWRWGSPSSPPLPPVSSPCPDPIERFNPCPPSRQQSTLGDLVTADPSLARQLERHGLDYCCGGSRTIAEACASRGLAVDAVIAELTTDADRPSPAWTTMAADELVDHIEATHHRYLWQELPRLSALIDKVTSVHGARHPELDDVARCFDVAARRPRTPPRRRRSGCCSR